MDQQATRSKRHSYAEDYKRQVVDLVVSSGYAFTAVAAKVGLHPTPCGAGCGSMANLMPEPTRQGSQSGQRRFPDWNGIVMVHRWAVRQAEAPAGNLVRRTSHMVACRRRDQRPN